MKAVVYKKYGPPEVLKVEEVERPVPSDNEMLVKVHASSVSAGVLIARRGSHPDSKFFTLAARLMFGLIGPRKKILGYELSGTVESTGKDVKGFKAGDKVFGTTTGLKFGAYAEYVCLPEEWSKGVVALAPSGCSLTESAVVPIGGMTALHILRSAGIQPGQTMLLYGASGNVGMYSLQLAKHFGAVVTGVCSTSKMDHLRKLGADHVIDYTADDPAKSSERYDIVFDASGKVSRSRCRSSLKDGGTRLSVMTPTKERTEYLEFLTRLIDAGELDPSVDRVFPLDKAFEAHRYGDEGRKKGNIAIAVDPDAME